jgi:5-methylcytosine-specific restriction endonuclease McrA
MRGFAYPFGRRRSSAKIQPCEWGTVDHKIPRRAGGSDHPDNLVLCCHTCNSRKKHHTYEYFLIKRLTEIHGDQEARRLLKARGIHYE